MDIEEKFRIREAEIWFSKRMGGSSRASRFMPKYSRNAQRSLEAVKSSLVFSSGSFQGSRLKRIHLIEKALNTSKESKRIRTRPLSSGSLLLHNSKSFQKKKTKNLVKQKSLQFQPSKGKVPILTKDRLPQYQFSFDLQNGVMRSVSVLCKL